METFNKKISDNNTSISPQKVIFKNVRENVEKVWTTVYGENIIGGDNGNKKAIYEWQIEAKLEPCTAISIGILQLYHHTANKKITSETNPYLNLHVNCYGLYLTNLANGYAVLDSHDDSSKTTDNAFEDTLKLTSLAQDVNNLVNMKLDVGNKTISYYLNGIELGVAYKSIDFSQKYQLALSCFYEHNAWLKITSSTFYSHISTMGADESKVIPPIWHIIDTDELKVYDHVYRRLKAGLFDHHGIVISIKIKENRKKIKVMEMTAKGIKISRLSKFLAGYSCRLVYYNTPKFYETFQRCGSCHFEQASSIKAIKQRIKKAKTLMRDPNVYNVFGANCEEFATWLKTGLYKGANMSQLQGYVNTRFHLWNTAKGAGNSTITNGMTSAFSVAKATVKVAANAVDDAAMAVVRAAGNTVDDVAIQAVKTKAAVRGIVAGFGIAVGLELIFSARRLVKWHRNPTYLWCDLTRDCGRSWISSVVCAAIGVSSLAIGWWAILPVAGAGLLLAFIFHFFKVFDRKSHKQKVYIEYKLNAESSVTELKRVRRALKRKIRDERLHPDQWVGDTSELKWWETCFFQTKKAKRLEKYMFLTSVREMLAEDIGRGYVLFDDDVQSEPRPPIAITYK